jgi:glycosyltransferase involved in cell wall biosynthesis
MKNEIRVIAVQTNRLVCAEVAVFAALAQHATRPVEGQTRLRILLIQGVDDQTRAAVSNETATPAGLLFENISGLEILPLELGFLGTGEGTSIQKAISLLKLFCRIPKLLLEIGRWNPDVFYSAQQIWDIYLCSVLAWASRRPRVTHLHYVAGPWLGKGVLPLLRASSAVVCVSEFLQSGAARYGVRPGRLHLVYNSLLKDYSLPPRICQAARNRIRKSLSLSSEDRLIGMVAVLDERKGQDTLLAAVAGVAARILNLHLVLVGKVEPGQEQYVKRLQDMVAGFGLQERVHFLGVRSDIPDLLAAFDVFAHPSKNEPFGLAVAEASDAGLPVVAWNEGGIAEVVENGVSGLLAETGNVSALADCLFQLLSDPLRASEMGREGQERIRRTFSTEAATQSFMAAIEQVRNNKR